MDNKQIEYILSELKKTISCDVPNHRHLNPLRIDYEEFLKVFFNYPSNKKLNSYEYAQLIKEDKNLLKKYTLISIHYELFNYLSEYSHKKGEVSDKDVQFRINQILGIIETMTGFHINEMEFQYSSLPEPNPEPSPTTISKPKRKYKKKPKPSKPTKPLLREDEIPIRFDVNYFLEKTKHLNPIKDPQRFKRIMLMVITEEEKKIFFKEYFDFYNYKKRNIKHKISGWNLFGYTVWKGLPIDLLNYLDENERQKFSDDYEEFLKKSVERKSLIN